MSSSNKTSLGFNQWDATDPIRRVDFNKDNEIVNEVLESKVSEADLTPQWHTLEILSGTKGYYTSELWKPRYGISGNVVTVTGVMVEWISNRTMFVLPVGCRPKGNINIPVFITTSSGNNPEPGYVQINENGEVIPAYSIPSAVEEDRRWLHFFATYVTA